MNFLPSKKLLLIGAPLLVVLATAVWFVVARNSGDTSPISGLSAAQLPTAQALLSNIAASDSDSDGLLDWEEALWGTDPDNPDSDGDGTLDGQEVTQNRNPRIAGPDDELPKDIEKNSSALYDASLTETDRFSRDFFTNYLGLRKAEGELSATSQNFLVQQTLGSLDTSLSANELSKSDVRTSPDTSAEAVKRYGNKLGEIVDLYGKPEVDHELTIIQKSLETEDQEKIKELDIVIDSYQEVIARYQSTPAPINAREEHLELLNSMKGVALSLQGVRAVYADPILALTSMSEYFTQSERLLQALRALRQYFISQGVVFDENEPGNMFFNSTIL